MRNRIVLYVATVCVLALFALAYSYNTAPAGAVGAMKAAAAFVALGFVCHAHSYQLVKGATLGSIAFLPYLAAIILAPSWLSAALVTLSAALAEAFLRRARASAIKATFNIAQYSLSASSAVIGYTALGGQSLLNNAPIAILPYVVAFLLFTSINTFSVAGAIAVSENKSVASIWRQNNIGTLTYDALSLPVAYCFALIYNSFSIPGVIFLGVILLGARELYSKNRQLEKTNQDLLELMVASIEARDPYTSGHSRRVSHFSRIIGRAIGMRGRELERLTIAALLHDVGKIHEMFAPILQKPGKLTAEERAVIELHPIKSAELVAMVSELQDVVVPIRHHHENWNGTGYPDGLAGKAIPLFARVITFADTIDAMTTSRPYRAALGEAEVRAELKRCRGSQFDPEICDVLLASPHFSVLFDLPVPTTCDRLPAPTAVAA